MKFYASIVDASSAIQDFLLDRPAALPDDVRDRLRELTRQGSGAIPAVRAAAEMVFARIDTMPPEALVLAAEMVQQLDYYDLAGIRDDDRGQRMIAYLLDRADVTLSPAGLAFLEREPPDPAAEFAPLPEPDEAAAA